MATAIRQKTSKVISSSRTSVRAELLERASCAGCGEGSAWGGESSTSGKTGSGMFILPGRDLVGFEFLVLGMRIGLRGRGRFFRTIVSPEAGECPVKITVWWVGGVLFGRL